MDSSARGGDKVCKGGGGCIAMGWGGGGNKRLTFLGVKAASDVELQPICSFDSKKNWREPELWTP